MRALITPRIPNLFSFLIPLLRVGSGGGLKGKRGLSYSILGITS